MHKTVQHLVGIAEAATMVEISEDDAKQRLGRLRRTYGRPAALRASPDHLSWVHVSEVGLLRVVIHAALPAKAPASLWHLTGVAPRPATQQPRTVGKVRWVPPPKKVDPGPRRMCIHCSRMKDGPEFPQKRYDVCAACVPASKGSVDLMERAYRGGAPGLKR